MKSKTKELSEPLSVNKQAYLFEKKLNHIKSSYAQVLESKSQLYEDVSLLPFSKHTIRAALTILYGYHSVRRDEALASALKIAYMSIGDFQEVSDEEKRRMKDLHKKRELLEDLGMAADKSEVVGVIGEIAEILEISQRCGSASRQEYEEHVVEFDSFVQSFNEYREREGSTKNLRDFVDYYRFLLETHPSLVSTINQTRI